jgi:hypothetical protein
MRSATARRRRWRRSPPAAPSTRQATIRGATFFETGAARYAWLTKHIIVCTGEREPAGVKLRFYQVL